MKFFEDPKMELVKFAVEDIITTSVCDDDCDEDDFAMIGDCIA